MTCNFNFGDVNFSLLGLFKGPNIRKARDVNVPDESEKYFEKLNTERKREREREVCGSEAPTWKSSFGGF